jgi:hypothetical protein
LDKKHGTNLGTEKGPDSMISSQIVALVRCRGKCKI